MLESCRGLHLLQWVGVDRDCLRCASNVVWCDAMFSAVAAALRFSRCAREVFLSMCVLVVNRPSVPQFFLNRS